MRIARLTAATAFCGFAALAAAQQPPSQQQAAPPPEQQQGGLSDLEATVNQLRDETAPAETPARPPAAETPPQPRAEPAAQPPRTPVQAAAPAPPAPPLTAAQQAELDRIVARARLLIAIAGAGQVATQDLLSRVPDPTAAGVDGWIAEPEGNGMTVTFFHEQDEGPTAVYRANVLGSRVVSRDVFLGSYRPALSRQQARLAAARDATDRLESRPCTNQPFNVFVVPPERAGAPIDVYRMSAPSERAHFPLGGHFKAVINADGAIASQRSFVDGCPMLDLGPAPASGEQPRPIAVAGGADPLPSEMHMLISRMTGRPLLVTGGDPQRQWLVAGDRVAEVRNGRVVEPADSNASAARPQGR